MPPKTPTEIWNLPSAPALTGQERLVLDRDSLKTPNSTVRLNLNGLSAFVGNAIGIATKAPLLTEQVVVAASRALTDADAGKILICDTSQGVITLTAPETLAANWNVRVVREGASNAVIDGSGGQTLVGPAADAGTVTLATDRSGALLVRRSATEVWSAVLGGGGGSGGIPLMDPAPPVGTLIAADGAGGLTTAPRSARRLTVADAVVGTGDLTGVLTYETLPVDHDNTVWLEDDGTGPLFKMARLPSGVPVGTRVRYLNLALPPTEPNVDSQVYVGLASTSDFLPGTILMGGSAGPFPAMQLMPGTGLTLTLLDATGDPVWEAVADGGGGGGEPVEPSDDYPVRTVAPGGGEDPGISGRYSRADHRHELEPGLIKPRLESFIVGNALAGDTLETCDILDPGDGTGIATALSLRTERRTDIWLRPGTYDFSQETSPALPMAGAVGGVAMYSESRLTIRSARPRPKYGDPDVTIVVGQSRQLIDTYDVFNTHVTVQIVDVVINIQTDEGSTTGRCLIGDSRAAEPNPQGIVELERVSIWPPYYDNAPSTAETLESLFTCAHVKVTDVHINALNYHNGQAGGTEFIVFRCDNLEAHDCTLLGGDAVFTGFSAELHDCIVAGAAVSTGLPVISAEWSITGRNVTTQNSGSAPDTYLRARIFDLEDCTLSGSAPDGALVTSTSRTQAKRFARCSLSGYTSGFRFEDDGVAGGNIFFEDCTFKANIRRRVAGLESQTITAWSDNFAPRGIIHTGTGQHAGPVGTLRGASNFQAHALIQMVSAPADLETIFGNWNRYQPDGGWFLGVDAERFKIGVGQQSDLQVVETYGTGMQSFSSYVGRLFGRTFLVSLSVRSGVAYLLINGQQVQSLAPSGGFQPAAASLTPFVGRNTNTGDLTRCPSVRVLGVGYGEGAHTSASITAYFQQVMDRGRLVHSAALTNTFNQEQYAYASIGLATEVGAVDLTLTGSGQTVSATKLTF